jgi:hypothetical protein
MKLASLSIDEDLHNMALNNNAWPSLDIVRGQLL